MAYELRRLLYASALILIIALSLGGIYLLRVMMGVPHPLMVVVSQSMVPTLGVGDLILVASIGDLGDVEAAPPPKGEIIVFEKPASPGEYIVHRAIEKYRVANRWFFVTKGDNNPMADSTPIPGDHVMGRVVGRIPILGYLPLLLRTRGGMALILALMLLILLSDILIPMRGEADSGGVINPMALLTLLPAPLTYLLLLRLDVGVEVELLSLASWYAGCLLLPLALDDDSSMILWLYHFVLTIIPIACDLVWRLYGITPSTWWYVSGSSVPVSLLLMRETPLCREAFRHILTFTLPGCLLFFSVLTAKRRGLLTRRRGETSI